MSIALDQHKISFYGDELLGVQRDDGTVYAPFSRLCENLGLGRIGQVQRVQRHAILGDALVTLTVQTSGGPQDIQCLRIDALPLWLSGLQASRVKEELRDKLIRYQKEAASVLWQAFKGQIVREDADELASSTDTDLTQLQQIVAMGHAIAQMAQEQIEQRRRMNIAARMVKGLQTDVAEIQVRLGVLEDKVNPAAYIRDDQASEVLNKVKVLAEWLTTHDKSKNHYQAIYTELYRRFNVTGYTFLRQEQFESEVAFLDEWRKAGENGV